MSLDHRPCFRSLLNRPLCHLHSWDRAINRKSIVDKLGGLILIGGLLANVMVTIGLTFVSVNNYPGGEAIEALKRIGASTGRSGEQVRDVGMGQVLIR